jgi:hypothetical protein
MPERTGSPTLGGVPFRVCIFFAANPEEILTSADIAVKFDVEPKSVAPTLLHTVKAGYLACESRRGGNVRVHNIYSAGPNLLAA